MKHTKTQKQAVDKLLRIDQLGYKIDDIGVIFFVWLAKKGYLSYYNKTKPRKPTASAVG